MVMIMIPGLGFLYSGLARRKSALSLIWACVGSSLVITFQWYFWGYSLAFSKTATNGFIGNLKHFALLDMLAAPSPGSPLVPELLYSFYQVGLAFYERAKVPWLTRRCRCNLPLLQSLSLWVLLLSVGEYCLRWFSLSYGQRSSTVLLRAGCGMSTDGHSTMASWITQVNLT